MNTSDSLYLELTRRLPSWVFRGLARTLVPGDPVRYDTHTADSFRYDQPQQPDETITKDPIYGPLCTLFADYYHWLEELLAQTNLNDADGPWLDLHAADRNRPRRPFEADATLRRRLRQVPDIATEKALVDAVVDAIKPGTPAAWQYCYWGLAFYNRQRTYPDLHVQCFTLRYRYLVLTDQKHTAPGRRYWGRSLWAITLPAPIILHARSFTWKDAWWGTAAWSQTYLRGAPVSAQNPFAVAVVVVPPQNINVYTAWQRNHWNADPWGGTSPNTQRYKAIRQAVEEHRAAGTLIEIWIRESSV